MRTVVSAQSCKTTDDIYFEIKGWWRDDAYIKYNSFKIQYSNIEIIIIDKSELLKLGILKK